MKNIFIFFFITCLSLNGQIPDFPPRNKLNEVHYDLFKAKQIEALSALNDENENFDWKSYFFGWHLFSYYLKVYPENKDVIIKLFHDRLSYEPVTFCDEYPNLITTIFPKTDTAYIYYKQEFLYMANVCQCILDQQNSKLKQVLVQIKKDDQAFRDNPDFMSDKEMQDNQALLDSLNLIKIESIIKTFGYPNRRLVGIELDDVAFLVILHSRREIIEKYIRLVKQEVENRNIRSKCFAYLFDRLQMFKGLPQTYGTQIIGQDGEGKPILYECIDLPNLNLRRYQMRLEMLDNYPKSKSIEISLRNHGYK